ncbi:MAG TPA: twin-arginine translocase subunit TatC, partial [Flexistipes sinusarabici]|nr:twin-arginine translocase subunit TatC [Flexistipes sinusarabici]
NRRYAIVILFIAAAIFTPPDVFTQMMMAGPLILLYEISVFVAKIFGRKSDLNEEDIYE